MATYSPYASTSMHSPASPTFSPMELTKDSAYNSPGPRQSFFDLTTGGGGPPIIKREPRKLPGTSVYRTISGILGFKEPPSLALCTFFDYALGLSC